MALDRRKDTMPFGRLTLGLLLGLWLGGGGGASVRGASAEAKAAPAPHRLAAAADQTWPEPGPAQVEALLAELKAQLPEKQFLFMREGLWLIATDLRPDEAQHFIAVTIGQYAARLQRQLFTAHVRRQPVKIYLFKNQASYYHWNEKLFGEKPHTPFGYYRRAGPEMVMNIGTGGGTLLHEMVHALAEVDYPEIPAWLNEGLGSLYEAAALDSGKRVVGVKNWRWKGLREALQSKSAPPLEKLLRCSEDEFYDEESSAVNYALARYLMQYLQSQGKLEAFYWSLRDGREPDGPAALRAVFENRKTVAEIESDFLGWVNRL